MNQRNQSSESVLEGGFRSEAFFPLGLPIRREASDFYAVPGLRSQAASGGGDPVSMTLRRLSDGMNRRVMDGFEPAEPVRAGRLITAALVFDVFRYLIRVYAIDQQPGVGGRGLDTLEAALSREETANTLWAFGVAYPPYPVAAGDETLDAFFVAASDGLPRREEVLWELVLLALAHANKAMTFCRPLIDDATLRKRADYHRWVDGFVNHLAGEPPFEPLGVPIIEALLAPLRACPNDIECQLEYILREWSGFLPAELVRRLRVVRGVLREEGQLRGHGPGPSVALSRGQGLLGNDGYPEPERFTADKDWMSNVVLLAKSAYVWLDQLSKKYGREIRHLDEIPDEELDRIAHWGFNGIWLIGLWERSCTSQWIKQRMGNADAAASAYSLYDYIVAGDLGGQGAYDNLKARAWRRGIRLASDMVPNHVGIFSRWIVEHPDWFVQLHYPPFPNYAFTGPDLSPDENIVLQIEDGYWEHRDAAVVFKRIDKRTGDTRYIYHGNDGTSMPWNDTAQLNYLNPEVREAVIQTILHVARLSPIIRFDAAMTLAKKHFQRLWFPKPGEGAIPSRAEFGMSREAFDAAMPEEFWREVVDRVQAEQPETLLLAEAFWLMEGYFVRTLGMHRVYNSAFMNMLKMEDNEKYRMTVRNVLEFSPQVLKRFVNFMSNPDERTAIDQFGKDDKYFGCCTLLSTMPGLPMFGHGQIEGFTEKYGMEYRRAYWNEAPDEALVWRHEREIFPLLRKRYLFSGVEHFAFYDFVTPEGHVDHNVFAYSNRAGGERGVVIYNNAYTTTRGRIQFAAAINRGSADAPQVEHPSLMQALDMDAGDNVYYIFRDQRQNAEYVRTARQIAHEGLYVELHGYQCHVFLDFRRVVDTDGSWGALCHQLGGRGVESAELARKRMQLSPLLDNFRTFFSEDLLTLLESGGTAKGAAGRAAFGKVLDEFFAEAAMYTTVAFDPEAIAEQVLSELDSLFAVERRLKGAGQATAPERRLLELLEGAEDDPSAPAPTPAVAAATPVVGDDADAALPEAFAPPAPVPPDWRRLAVTWVLMRSVGEAFAGTDYATTSAEWMDDWLLTPRIAEVLAGEGRELWRGYEDARLVSIAIEHGHVLGTAASDRASALFADLLDDERVREYLYVNYYQGAHYLRKEQLETLIDWLYLAGALILAYDATITPERWRMAVANRLEACAAIMAAAETGGYRIDRMQAALAPAEGRSGLGDKAEERPLG